MPAVPFLGFTPDAPSDTPGVITALSNVIPTEKGLAGAPSGIAPSGVGALAAPCVGAAVVVSTDGSRRTYAGTTTRLYELVAGTWTDRSRVALYTGTSDTRWIFTQFGNATIATNDGAVLQASVGGAFSDIATAPQAKVVVSVANFVLAFNTVDGTFGDQSDRWWCSAFQDHTSWTPSVTTQATTGRLVGEGGEITAACRLGQNVVVYKGRAMWLGQYVGPPAVWQFDQVPGEVGCVGSEAVVDVGGANVFVGEDNIWLYDGTRPVPIATGQVRQWFFNNSSALYRYKTLCTFDRQNNRVYFWYVSRNSTTGVLDSCLVYHMQTKQWGSADQTIQTAINYVGAGATYDTTSGTYDAAPNVPYDSQYWLSGGRAPAVFNSSNQVLTLTGASTCGALVTGDVGDDDYESFVRRVRLRFLQEPASATITGQIKDGLGGTLLAGDSGVLADAKFDLRQAARWHRFSFTFTGDFELTSMNVDAVAGGKR
ncbi:hypothetical protein IP84_17040 [beta proteobacterium AAP99]|nr:hypothetical protein IP84_17040 [beta proteobacterium AAP99]